VVVVCSSLVLCHADFFCSCREPKKPSGLESVAKIA
jgi:hypothetical protein